MKEYYFEGNFGDISLKYAFRHPETALFFREFLKPITETLPDDVPIVRVPKEDYDSWISQYGMREDGNTEFGLSVYRAGDQLSKYGSCIIHAAAFGWNGKAYLFAADGGTGKSTQLRRWMELYYQEIIVLNGDKPILKFSENQQIMVCPSPWKGKEEWGNDRVCMPLGGIIFLKQGKENKIQKMDSLHTAARLLTFFFCTYSSKEVMDEVSKIADIIVRTIPIWQLTNRGDLTSAQLTHDTVFDFLQEERETEERPRKAEIATDKSDIDWKEPLNQKETYGGKDSCVKEKNKGETCLQGDNSSLNEVQPLKLREDVVLEQVGGIFILVALRSAWDECPFALQIAPVSAFIWESVREGKAKQEIIKAIVENRKIPEEKARRIYAMFENAVEKYHYFAKEP